MGGWFDGFSVDVCEDWCLKKLVMMMKNRKP